MARILVVEDEGPIRDNLRRFLRLAGHDVIEAENGRVAIERLRTARPELVLCDLMMPDMDGYGVLEALRADPATAGVPFVFITASAEKEEMQQGLTRGASAYVTKPFNLQVLGEVIERALREGR